MTHVYIKKREANHSKFIFIFLPWECFLDNLKNKLDHFSDHYKEEDLYITEHYNDPDHNMNF